MSPVVRPIVGVMPLPELAAVAPRLAVLAAVTLAGLCVQCVAAITGLSGSSVGAQFRDISAKRRESGLEGIGPFDARCQRCEALTLVYALR